MSLRINATHTKPYGSCQPSGGTSKPKGFFGGTGSWVLDSVHKVNKLVRGCLGCAPGYAKLSQREFIVMTPSSSAESSPSGSRKNSLTPAQVLLGAPRTTSVSQESVNSEEIQEL